MVLHQVLAVQDILHKRWFSRTVLTIKMCQFHQNECKPNECSHDLIGATLKVSEHPLDHVGQELAGIALQELNHLQVPVLRTT